MVSWFKLPKQIEKIGDINKPRPKFMDESSLGPGSNLQLYVYYSVASFPVFPQSEKWPSSPDFITAGQSCQIQYKRIARPLYAISSPHVRVVEFSGSVAVPSSAEKTHTTS